MAGVVFPRRLVWGAVLFALSACATPAERLDDEAGRLGFTRRLVRGGDFLHVAYLKQAPEPGATLHVYLEGDGVPWMDRATVSPDPTPRNPLMLRLMALDPAPSVYLGRPCYHGLAATPPCTPRLWTDERFSGPVVDSLAAALRNLVGARRPAGLVWFGHSGGGTLAVLLAERFPATRAVVTIAGNLDIDAWARHHGFSPLAGSLNPAARPPLDPGIVQWHLVGGRDGKVPPALSKAAVSGRRRGEMITFAAYGHTCCWDAVWPNILARLAAAVTSAGGDRR